MVPPCDPLVGPLLDRVLAAANDLDVGVAYTAPPRPFDHDGLCQVGATDIVLVEPYLAGTSANEITTALSHGPMRLRSTDALLHWSQDQN